jgi:hypothetical protein
VEARPDARLDDLVERLSKAGERTRQQALRDSRALLVIS